MQIEIIKRALHLGKARCAICGVEYERRNGRQKYCSNGCAQKAAIARCREYRKQHPRPWKPPREIVCIKCGETFLGKGRQQICMNCLMTRKDCRRYIDMRSEAYAVKEEGCGQYGKA